MVYSCVCAARRPSVWFQSCASAYEVRVSFPRASNQDENIVIGTIRLDVTRARFGTTE